MHVRTGRAARGADEGQGVTTGNGSAYGDVERLVVAVARDQAIAMADLDEGSIAGLFTREGNDAGRHRDHVRALRSCEIDALVEGLVTVERILTLTEIRGDVTFPHGAAIGANLFVELLRQQRVLERRQLRVARG